MDDPIEEDQPQSTPPGQPAQPVAAADGVANEDDQVQSTPETAGPAGDFGLGTRVYGYIGTMAHVVTDGRTTACGKQIDQTSAVERLARTPGGLLCGTCLGKLIGA